MIQSIPAGARIGVDTVAVIYFLEDHPEFGAPARRLFEQIEAGELEAVMSTLVLTELLVPLYRAGQERAADELSRRLRNFRNLEMRPVTDATASLAARLRARYGLKTPDAIHAANAIEAEASGIVTNDRDLGALGDELEAWTFR
jgi:predicted nucleic acid-binding protein